MAFSPDRPDQPICVKEVEEGSLIPYLVCRKAKKRQRGGASPGPRGVEQHYLFFTAPLELASTSTHL